MGRYPSRLSIPCVFFSMVGGALSDTSVAAGADAEWAQATKNGSERSRDARADPERRTTRSWRCDKVIPSVPKTGGEASRTARPCRALIRSSSERTARSGYGGGPHMTTPAPPEGERRLGDRVRLHGELSPGMKMLLLFLGLGLLAVLFAVTNPEASLRHLRVGFLSGDLKGNYFATVDRLAVA